MPNYKVMVTKITEHYEIVEVEAINDQEAMRSAILILKGEDSELRWIRDKVRFKAEVLHG
jgi:hypothetical protein